MSLSPAQRFQQHKDNAQLIDDPTKTKAVALLDTLYADILAGTPHPKGIYLWGDVGRGKTMLMDLLCHSLPKGVALRLHFHRFMAKIHDEMRAESGRRDPLIQIAKRLRQEYRLICFDEFFVSDIGDAMILATLFDALFKQGLILVATSNTPIAKLYENGLARDRFLPTISLLQQYTESFHLNGETDHRLRHLTKHQTYFHDTPADFAAIYDSLETETASDHPLTLFGRDIPVIRRGATTLWLTFDALCEGPRSQLDYIEVASQFDTILLSNVPALGGTPRSWIKARGTEDGATAVAAGERQLHYAPNDDPARRFIALVDELYDQGVRLYLQACLPLEQLYTPGALGFEFKRTQSRLIEMQSMEYFSSTTAAEASG